MIPSQTVSLIYFICINLIGRDHYSPSPFSPTSAHGEREQEEPSIKSTIEYGKSLFGGIFSAVNNIVETAYKGPKDPSLNGLSSFDLRPEDQVQEFKSSYAPGANSDSNDTVPLFVPSSESNPYAAPTSAYSESQAQFYQPSNYSAPYYNTEPQQAYPNDYSSYQYPYHYDKNDFDDVQPAQANYDAAPQQPLDLNDLTQQTNESEGDDWFKDYSNKLNSISDNNNPVTESEPIPFFQESNANPAGQEYDQLFGDQTYGELPIDHNISIADVSDPVQRPDEPVAKDPVYDSFFPQTDSSNQFESMFNSAPANDPFSNVAPPKAPSVRSKTPSPTLNARDSPNEPVAPMNAPPMGPLGFQARASSFVTSQKSSAPAAPPSSSIKAFELQTQEHRLNAFESRLHAESDHILQLQHELEQKRSALLEREQTLDKRSLDMDKARTELEMRQAHVQDLEQKQVSKSAQIEDEGKRVKKLLEKLEIDRAAIQQAEAKLNVKDKDIESKKRGLLDLKGQLDARLKTVEERERDIKTAVQRAEAEKEKYSKAVKEVEIQKTVLEKEKKQVDEIRYSYETKSKEIADIQSKLREEARICEENVLTLKRREETVAQFEANVQAMEADVRAQQKRLESDVAQFESKKAAFQKEAEYIEDKKRKIDASLQEWKSKQSSSQDEVKKYQQLNAELEKEKIQIERERSLLLERETELRKRSEGLLNQQGSEGTKVQALKQQIENERQLFERERQMFSTRQMELQAKQDELNRALEVQKKEQERMNEYKRHISSENSKLEAKKQKMDAFLKDLRSKKESFDNASVNIKKQAQEIENEKKSLSNAWKQLNEDRKKFTQHIEMRNSGKDIEALQRTVADQYAAKLREKDLRVRQVEEESRKKIYELEDKLFRLQQQVNEQQLKQSTSALGLNSSMRSDVYKQPTVESHGKKSDLTPREIHELSEAATRELQRADLKQLSTNKSRYDLLNVIIALTRYFFPSWISTRLTS